ILTANDISNSNIGISIWTSSEPALSSNTIVDSKTGVELLWVTAPYLLGNVISNATLGLYLEEITKGEILDGTYQDVETGITALASPQLIIHGNTFDEITGDAIQLDDSNASYVFWNNFYDVAGKYGEIENCIVFYEYEINNETIVGNYYDNEQASEIVIDEVEYEGQTYVIIDSHPLAEEYVVPPAVSIVTRDVIKPDDTMIVNVTAQVYTPSGLTTTVSLEYITTTDQTWTLIPMTLDYSIGQVNVYTGSIPKLDYDLEVTYRIRVDYGTETVYSDNSTYVIQFSDETPIIIRDPTVLVRADGSEDFTVTSTYYEQYYIIVQVQIINQTTNLQRINGKDYVNISWTKYTSDGEIETYANIMDYNSTTGYFYLELGRFSANTNITFRIYAEDDLGNSRWTLETYNIEIVSETTEEAGFDSLTLLGITATLFLVQTIVVIRRRKQRED
ncbi:MAG: NosD domain-containing protein, partial [Candidatus Heimdallarchaeaceae archaeon]